MMARDVSSWLTALLDFHRRTPKISPPMRAIEHHTHSQLEVSRADVEDNFRRFGLLDERVVFLEGWFKDTLPDAPIDRLAVLRLDGDMYESTIEALDALYHKVSYGGFVIVDDYFLPACAKAVDDFRGRYGITSPILPIDGWGRIGVSITRRSDNLS